MIKEKIIKVDGTDAFIAANARVCFGCDVEEELARLEADDAATKRIIERLYREKASKAFMSSSIQWQIFAPIFVARHFYVYDTAVKLEKSLRYSSPFDDETLDADVRASRKRYRELVEGGSKKEDARKVLTLAEPTTFTFKMDVWNLFNFFRQRLSERAQGETRRLAESMFDDFRKYFPLCWGACEL